MANNKKKYIITGGVAVTALAVAGTLAFLTSTDTITNPFGIAGGGTDNTVNAGIEIWEQFGPGETAWSKEDPATVGPVLPAVNVNKDVIVKSTVNYDQYVRASIATGYTVKIGEQTHDITTVYTDKVTTDPTAAISGYKTSNEEYISVSGETFTVPTETNLIHSLDLSKIHVVLKTSGAFGSGEATWTDVTNDYYYYNQILKPNHYTTELVDYVYLDESVSNIYKNLGFNVTVTAEAIQATGTAWTNAVASGGWNTPGTVPTAPSSLTVAPTPVKQ